MAQSFKNKIAIVGSGPAGVMCAIKASENMTNEITIFEKNSQALMTILPTGGKRCNLTYFEEDFKNFAKHYPRGEKFLYSAFSRFCFQDTVNFFASIGIKTYMQGDRRVFPVSNSSQDVRNALLKALQKENVRFRFEKVVSIEKIKNSFIVSSQTNQYEFDSVVIATGGKGNIEELNRFLNHSLVKRTGALCALNVEEKFLYNLSGVTLKNVRAHAFDTTIVDDMLICHRFLSGPLIFKISSYFAYQKMPFAVELNFINKSRESFQKTLTELINHEKEKFFINTVSKFVPKSFARIIFFKDKIKYDIKNSEVGKKSIEKIAYSLCNFNINVISKVKHGEIVTAGGFDIDEINNQNFMSKKHKKLYFVGETINIDGLTGVFNLQNCWTSGFLAGDDLKKS